MGLEMTVQAGDGSLYGALALADVLVPEGEAKTLLSYGARYYAGRPAAVENVFGRGRCLYLGTVPDDEGLRPCCAPGSSIRSGCPPWTTCPTASRSRGAAKAIRPMPFTSTTARTPSRCRCPRRASIC